VWAVSSETLVSAYEATRRHNPKEKHRRLHQREKLKSQTSGLKSEEEGSKFLRNVGIYQQIHAALQPRRQTLACSKYILCEFVFLYGHRAHLLRI
jgi:thermostable 8-oxoguanine DNA glycosylase